MALREDRSYFSFGFFPGVLQGGQVSGAGAEDRDAQILGHFPQRARIGMERVAFVEDHRLRPRTGS